MHDKFPRELPSDFHCPFVLQCEPRPFRLVAGLATRREFDFEVVTVSNGGNMKNTVLHF